MLKDLVRERLIAAADEIFGLIERTIASYEEQLCRARQESEQQRRQLEAISKTQLAFHVKDTQSQSDHQVQTRPPHLQGGTTSLEHPQSFYVKEEAAAAMKPEEATESQHMTTESKGDHREASQADHLFAPLSDSDDIDELLGSGTDSEEELEESSSLEHPQQPHIKEEDDEESGVGNLLLTGALVKSEDDDKSPDWSPPDHHSLTASTRSHMITRAREKLLYCSICGHRFSRKSHLAVHMRKHREDHSLRCLVCGESFSSSVALIAHNLTHAVNKALVCPICGKIFSCKRSLNDHIQIHRDESFNCSICNKRFGQKVSLEWHMKTHVVGKTLTCSFCGKIFSREPAMVTHMRIHTGGKDFACLVCGRRFCVEANMVSHMKTHNEEMSVN